MYGCCLPVVVVTFAAAGLAILIGAYTAFFAPAERLRFWSCVRLRFWSCVSSGLAVLAIFGFGLGWFYGLAVDA